MNRTGIPAWHQYHSLLPHSILVAMTLLIAAVSPTRAALDPGDTYQPRNTQPAGQNPPSPQDSVRALKLPSGFRATLFAGEPDVRQPIDMKIDDRGRVWVCEAYSYHEWKRNGEDRIVILTDRDGDGVADARKIFRSGFHHLSSVEIGFGGVWVLDSPHLLFFPDADGDDSPDAEPEVLLEGWTTIGEHNVVSGLTWGPDGWLYGRHGITNPSMVGKPGATAEERTFIEPGVWRIHPVTREFEVVLRGMTNPWGLDWDERGEMFLSGNVNGHLWHGIPGALYERMFGAGSVPHDYERLLMIGEKPHYPSSGDWKQDWLRADKGRDATSQLGGGHSHCGLMIYQGDNWPEASRGRLFMCNTHGRRVNIEEVARRGSSFSSRHVGDIFVSEDPWFRGVSLVTGPDGAVLVSDWCDNGECHDADGVHRSSGRIYKIIFGEGAPAKVNPDLPRMTDDQLASLLTAKNAWHVRHASRLLQERSVRSPRPLTAPTVAGLHGLAKSEVTPLRLRAFWTLHASGELTATELHAASESPDESIRAWAARLMCDDRDLLETEASRLVSMAESDRSPVVRLYLASLIPRVPPGIRWPIARALGSRAEDADDHTLQLVLWHNLEALVPADPDEAVRMLRSCVFPNVRQFIARRLAGEIDDERTREAIGRLLESAAGAESSQTGDIVVGVRTGLNGRTGLTAPRSWAATAPVLLAHSSNTIREAALDLSVAFGDPGTLDQLRATLRDRAAPAADRNAALARLIRARPDDLPPVLESAIDDPSLRVTALRGLAGGSGGGEPERLIGGYPTFDTDAKQAALDALVTRADSAQALVEAMAAGKIPRADVTPTHARLLLALGNARLKADLEKVWGTIASSNAAREEQIAQLKASLSRPDRPPGEPGRGREVFARVCGACHRLFGEGGRIGPDLTGSGRKELDYLVRNIVDPNATVPRDFRMTTVMLKNGQVLSGVVPREDDRSLTLQSIAEARVLDRDQVARIDVQPYSWMPEGLLNGLSEQEVLDLVAYLQK